MLESVRFFRSLGFFESERTLPDAQLAVKLKQLQSGRMPDDRTVVQDARFQPAAETADLQLLWWDDCRVWWKDLEADVTRGNEVYRATLREWSRISRGSFEPTAIVESWRGADGPVQISFALNGRRHVVTPRYDPDLYASDFIDPGILCDINDLIEPSGMRFYQYRLEFDQTAFVVVLTPDEARRLQTDRGWRFWRCGEDYP